jgi:hypothetical protein
MINEKQVILLNKYNWVFDSYDTVKLFSLTHAEGSCIKNSEESFIFLLEELEELEDEASTKEPESIETVLKFFGYELICESPLEITKIDDKDVFVSGMAASILVSNLRSKKFIKEYK